MSCDFPTARIPDPPAPVQIGGSMELVQLYLSIHRMRGRRRPLPSDILVPEGFERLSNGMIVPRKPRPAEDPFFEEIQKKMERTDKFFRILIAIIGILGVAGIVTAALQ